MHSYRLFRSRSVFLGALPGVLLIAGYCLFSADHQLASAAMPTLTIGSISAHPFVQANFNVTLANAGAPIVAVQNDIVFDPVHAPIALTNTGQPNCTVNSSLGKQGTFGFLPSGCSGTNCTIVRAEISSLSNQGGILPSTVLYTCTIVGNTIGAYPLTAFHPVGSDSTGKPIQLTTVNGSLSVTPSGCF